MGDNTANEHSSDDDFHAPHSPDDDDVSYEGAEIIDISNFGGRTAQVGSGNDDVSSNERGSTSILSTIGDIYNASVDNLDNLEEDHDAALNGSATLKKPQTTKRIRKKDYRRRYMCTQCDLIVSRTYLMDKHVEKEHGGITKCGQCDFETTLTTLLGMHVRKFHNSIQGSRSSHRRFTCFNCEYSCSRPYLLRNHVRKQHKGILTCDRCDYTTTSLYSLRRHIMTHESKPLHKCTFCEYQSDRRYTIKKHELTHRKEPLKCGMCPRTFKLRRSLRKHVKKDHSDDENYLCQQCNYWTNDAANLKNHISALHKSGDVGIPEETYDCPKCPYWTDKIVDLKSHVSAFHQSVSTGNVAFSRATSDGSYKCPNCSYCTNQMADLKSHISVFHESGTAGNFGENSLLSPYGGDRRWSYSSRDDASNRGSFDDYLEGFCNPNDPMLITNFHSSSTAHARERGISEDSKDDTGDTSTLCESCGYQSRNLQELQEHIKSHNDPVENRYVKKRLSTTDQRQSHQMDQSYEDDPFNSILQNFFRTFS